MNYDALFSDPTFWVAVSFAIFVLMVYRPVSRAMTKGLDARADRVSAELAEAVRLREEAEELLATYKRKQTQVEAEAEAILRSAREEALSIQKQAQEQLHNAVASRMALADQKIAQEEEKAIEDVKKQVVDIALKAARDVISDKLADEADDSLIRLALKDINRIVH